MATRSDNFAQGLNSKQPENLLPAPTKGELKKPNAIIHPEQYRKGLKPAHQLVIRALEVANLAFSRVVTVAEIISALTPKEIKHLRKSYAKELTTLIPSILEMLRRRGLVFTPGIISKKRYYGSVSVLDPEKSQLPNAVSRRRRVLGLVYRAVEHFGRSVRAGDVLDYVAQNPQTQDIEAALITRDMMNLSETGELRLVGTVRGDEKGINLYLPCDLDPESYKPSEPLTWLEEVSQATHQLCNEELNRATEEGRKMRPIATGEVRVRLAAAPRPHPNLDDPRLLPNALLQLARTDDGSIRRVERPGKQSLMWAPVGMKDEALELGDAYVSDAERAAEAVERAYTRLGRPVNVQDITNEVSMDPTLEPAGKLKLRNILSDISKETIDTGGKRRERVVRRCFYVGKVRGDSYYCHDAVLVGEACSYVRFRQIELRWAQSVLMTVPSAYERCTVPVIAVGRAMLVQAEAEAFISDVDSLFTEPTIDNATRREAEALRDMSDQIRKHATAWIALNRAADLFVPDEVSLFIPGWTAAELLDIYRPLYLPAQKIESPHKITTLFSTKIRRIPNPNFETRFSKTPVKASEFLYDRTDALLFGATHWGGKECGMHAMIAKDELGWLRDARFVLPALRSKVFEERLKGVSCLAFLWSDEGNEQLKHIALNDCEPAVRQSALWAYGFAGGNGAKELLRERAGSDQDVRTRAFFMQMMACLELNDGLWWKV